MAHTNFTKQNLTEPAFPNLFWSKPQHVSARGKVLIIGGNRHSLTAPMKAYEYAMKANVGYPRVLLPASLKQHAGAILEHGEYAPYTPSGSFSKQALDTMLDNASWSDAVLIAGDVGKNSETAVLLQSFMHSFQGNIILAGDAVDAVLDDTQAFAHREQTTLLMSFSQFQKLVQKLTPEIAVTLALPTQRIVNVLINLTREYKLHLITTSHETVFVGSQGNGSITKTDTSTRDHILRTASFISVWIAQQPQKPFEAITSAVYESIHSLKSSSK